MIFFGEDNPTVVMPRKCFPCVIHILEYRWHGNVTRDGSSFPSLSHHTSITVNLSIAFSLLTHRPSSSNRPWRLIKEENDPEQHPRSRSGGAVWLCRSSADQRRIKSKLKRRRKTWQFLKGKLKPNLPFPPIPPPHSHGVLGGQTKLDLHHPISQSSYWSSPSSSCFVLFLHARVILIFTPSSFPFLSSSLSSSSPFTPSSSPFLSYPF